MSDELGTLASWPPSKAAFEDLKERFEYGLIVRWEELEEFFETEHRDNWDFRTHWLNLIRLIETEGFFVTERGQAGKGFRFLNRREMADHVKARENKKAHDSMRKSLCLSKIPREGLSELEAKKIDHWENKSAVLAATAMAILRKRELPSPEMMTKSVRQILATK